MDAMVGAATRVEEVWVAAREEAARAAATRDGGG